MLYFGDTFRRQQQNQKAMNEPQILQVRQQQKKTSSRFQENSVSRNDDR